MSNNNMLKVDGVACPSPSSYTWGLQDVSSSDAGRVQDGNDTMYKNRTSQKRKLNFVWNIKNPTVTAQILQMFNPEYINVTYWDAMDGKEETRVFYVGDRSAPIQQWYSGHELYQSISFNIIER